MSRLPQMRVHRWTGAKGGELLKISGDDSLLRRDSDGSTVSESFRTYRATSPEEILLIRDIVIEAHNEGRYSQITFSEKKFIRAFTRAISSPADTLSLYVRHKERTVAIINVGVGDYYLGEGGRIATIYAFYVSSKIRSTLLGGRIAVRLLRIASEWARDHGAFELHIHSTSGLTPRRTDRFLRKLGFDTFGGNYFAAVRAL